MRRGFDPGLINGEQLETTAKGIQWFVAATFVFISLVGTFVQFVGGWYHLWDFDRAWVMALLISIGFQLVLSAGQFAFLKVGAWFWYAGCLAVSVIPSIMSYWELTGDYFAQKATEPGALVLVIIACVALDCVPERILVKRH